MTARGACSLPVGSPRFLVRAMPGSRTIRSSRLMAFGLVAANVEARRRGERMAACWSVAAVSPGWPLGCLRAGTNAACRDERHESRICALDRRDGRVVWCFAQGPLHPGDRSIFVSNSEVVTPVLVGGASTVAGIDASTVRLIWSRDGGGFRRSADPSCTSWSPARAPVHPSLRLPVNR